MAAAAGFAIGLLDAHAGGDRLVLDAATAPVHGFAVEDGRERIDPRRWGLT